MILLNKEIVMAEEEVRVEEKDFRIEVTKNTKGYNWSVRVVSNDVEDIKKKTDELEKWCQATYGSKE